MKGIRLEGAALRLAASLAGTAAGRFLLRKQVEGVFGIDRLMSLPTVARMPLDNLPQVVAGAPPRSWGNGDCGLPVSRSRQGTREIAATFASGESTPTSLLARLEARVGAGDFGRALHSPLVTLAFDHEAAAASTTRWREGRQLGPLDGQPIPIKDHQPLRGVALRGGTSYLSAISEEDGFAAASLRAQGALLYATTHCTEWGMAPTGINPHFLMPRNLYHENLGAGGSSTGSAVAVALGLAPVALASDGGGSIRIPSALNGLFGLKPTFARIGRTGDLWGSGSSVATLGPIGQTTASLVDFLTPFEATDPGDTMSRLAPSNPDLRASWNRALGRGIRGCRIGLWSWAWKRANPRIAAVCRTAVEALIREGAIIVDLDIELGDQTEAMGSLAIGAESMGGLFDHLAAIPHLTGDDIKLVLASFDTLSAREYFYGARTRATLRRTTARALAGVDLLCLPTTDLLAPSYPASADHRHILDPEETAALCRFSWLGNLTGLPAGSAPVGMLDGLPVGLQFVGDAWDEASVIAALAHVERLELSELPRPRGYAQLV